MRKALKRENMNATKVVSKHGIQLKKEVDGKAVLKMGPKIKGNVTMAQITKDVNSMPASQLIMPQANQQQLPGKLGFS